MEKIESKTKKAELKLWLISLLFCSRKKTSLYSGVIQKLRHSCFFIFAVLADKIVQKMDYVFGLV
jgi:hypothetical protein